MKILVVTWFFPPANTMGALRVGKFVEHLIENDCEVRVVAANFQPPSPPLEFVPDCHVVRTNWIDINRLPAKLVGRVKRIISRSAQGTAPRGGPLAEGRSAQRSRLRRRLADAYQMIADFPDKQVGWLPFALRAGAKELHSYTPDLVFATAPPFTAAVAGRMLARRAGAPLVVEMRDRWSDDPYREIPGVRARLERWLERHTLGAAAGIATVSQPWAEMYACRHKKPCVTVYNGFDPRDFARARAMPGERDGQACLVIRHVGRIYPGRRDPTPLFRAIAGLEAQERCRIRVEFLGGADGVGELADRWGVRENVVCLPPVSYHEALRKQMDADIVLLLQWNDPAEHGNVPGKLFEYLATRRPILGHGDTTGVPAAIVKARDAGVYANDPAEVRAFLQAKLAEKRRTGRVAANPSSVHEGFERSVAYRGLEAFLRQCAGEPRHAGSASHTETANAEVNPGHQPCDQP